MKKRIALIVLIALYLVVPAVIKRLPIYEYAGNDEEKIYRVSVLDKLKGLYYKNFQPEITLDINGEKVKTYFYKLSYHDMYAVYKDDSDLYDVVYSFKIADKDKFKIILRDIDVEIPGLGDYATATEAFNDASEIVLSNYLDLNKYTNVERYTLGMSVGQRYFTEIDGYATYEGAYAVFQGSWEKPLPYIIDINFSDIFSKSEKAFDVDEEQVWKIFTENTNIENYRYYESPSKSKLGYAISKSPKGDLILFTEYWYIYLFPRTAWLVSKYVLGISATLMFTWVLVSEIKAHRRKKSAPIPTEQEEQTE